MKKKMIMLAVLLLAGAALLGIYGYAKKQPKPEPEPAQPAVSEQSKYKLIDIKPEDVKSIAVEGGGKSVVFTVSDSGISVENADMALLDKELVVMMFNALVSVSSDNKISEPEALSVYGLDVPQACAEYETANGSKTLFIGDITPDGSYYYAMTGGDTAVYTIGKMTGERIMQDVTAMADLDIAVLNANGLSRLEVKQKDRDELSISFDKENSAANANLDKSGLQTLVMHKPIENLLVYPYNLEPADDDTYGGYRKRCCAECRQA